MAPTSLKEFSQAIGATGKWELAPPEILAAETLAADMFAA